MVGWLFGTPLGRFVQGIVGTLLLLIGIEQVTVTGLLIMMTGLVAMVMAVAPPPFLTLVPVRRSSRRPH
jgi:hypothetical protein